VLATDVKPELLAAYKGVANVRTEVLDVLDRAAIEHTVGAMASLSVLFNCAGFVFNGTILQTEDRDWDFSFNLKRALAVLDHSRRAAEDDCRRRRIDHQHGVGRVQSEGHPNRFVYGASKAAVIGLTKAVAIDYVHRACVATPSVPHGGYAVAGRSHQCQRRSGRGAHSFIARQPMGRLAKAEEIAPLIVYLASDESAFATGQAFIIDGG